MCLCDLNQWPENDSRRVLVVERRLDGGPGSVSSQEEDDGYPHLELADALEDCCVKELTRDRTQSSIVHVPCSGHQTPLSRERRMY